MTAQVSELTYMRNNLMFCIFRTYTLLKCLGGEMVTEK